MAKYCKKKTIVKLKTALMLETLSTFPEGTNFSAALWLDRAAPFQLCGLRITYLWNPFEEYPRQMQR